MKRKRLAVWGVLLILLAVVGWHWSRRPSDFQLVDEYLLMSGSVTSTESGFLLHEAGNTLVLRDWVGGRERWRIENVPLGTPTTALCISPDGRWLAQANLETKGMRVAIWEEGELQGSYLLPRDPPFQRSKTSVILAMNNAGRAHAVFTDGVTTSLTALDSSGIVGHGPVPDGASITPDGAVVITGKPVPHRFHIFTADQNGVTLSAGIHYGSPAMLFPQGVIVGDFDIVYSANGSRKLGENQCFWWPTREHGSIDARPACISCPWVITTDKQADTCIYSFPSGLEFCWHSAGSYSTEERAYHIRHLSSTDYWTLSIPNRIRTAPILCQTGFVISGDGRYVLTRHRADRKFPHPLRWLKKWFPDLEHQAMFASHEEFHLYERPGHLQARLQLHTMGGLSWLNTRREPKRPNGALLSPDGHSLVIQGHSEVGDDYALLYRW